MGIDLLVELHKSCVCMSGRKKKEAEVILLDGSSADLIRLFWESSVKVIHNFMVNPLEQVLQFC